jgi:hypothetical protein
LTLHQIEAVAIVAGMLGLFVPDRRWCIIRVVDVERQPRALSAQGYRI